MASISSRTAWKSNRQPLWGAGVLFLVPALLPAGAPAAGKPVQVSPAASEKGPASQGKQGPLAQERDRLREDVANLRAANKLAETVTALKKVLALERKLRAGEDIVKTLEELGTLEERREEFPAARAARQEVLALRTAALGKSHWQAVDARLALGRLNRVAGLKPEQRRQLFQASQVALLWITLNQPAEIAKGVFVQGTVPVLFLSSPSTTSFLLHEPKHYRNAVAHLESALAVRRKILGTDQPDYAQTLTDLARLRAVQQDYAGAKRDCEQALAIRLRLLGDRHPDTAVSLLRLGALLVARKDYAAAQPWYGKALAIRTAVLGAAHADSVHTLLDVAWLLQARNDLPAARARYEQALALREKTVGRDHPKTAAVLRQLGDVLFDQGAYPEAQKCFERALAIVRKGPGGGGAEVADLLLSQGAVCQWRRDFAAAAGHWKEALAVSRKTRGEEHAETARLLHNLGHLFNQQKDYAAARPYYERALRVRQKILGPNHPDTFVTLNNLGYLLFEQGDYAAARPLIERALAVCRKVRGEYHPDTATSLTLLARLLRRQGNLAAAQPYLEQALAVRRKVQGAGHPDTINALETLSNLLADREDHAGARKYCAEAVALSKKVLGERHPDTALALNNLGALLVKLKDYAEARRLLEQALAIYQAAPGKQPVTATVLMNLAGLWYQQGDHAKARPLLERALANLQADPGPEALQTALVFNSVGVMLADQGNHTDARRCLEQAASIRRHVLGDHPDTADSLMRLGSCLHGQRDHGEARKRYEQALAIYRKIRGERHLDTARCLSRLGVVLASQDDAAGARKCHEEALAIYRKVRGEAHPDTAEALTVLGAYFSNRRDYTAARNYLEQALRIYRNVPGGPHPGAAFALHAGGLVLQAQKHYAAAQKYFEESLALFRRESLRQYENTADTANALAKMRAAQGDYAGARKYHEQALAVFQRANAHHPGVAASLNRIGAVFHLQGDGVNARKYLEMALAATQRNLDLAAAGQSERQQLAMARELRYRLDSLLSLAGDINLSAAAAYAPQLAWKGVVFDRQRQRRILRARPELAPLADKLQACSSRLAAVAFSVPDARSAGAWKMRLAQLTEEKEGLERELARLATSFRKEKARAKLPPEELPKLLPEGVALVDFCKYTHFSPSPGPGARFDDDVRLTAFVIRKGKAIIRLDLGPLAPIAEAIDRWRTTLKRRIPARDDKDVAARLRLLLWEPVEDYLEGAHTVLISPDGALGRFPFAALPGKEKGKYLIEELAIAVLPVPRLLPELLEAPGKGTAGPPGGGASLLLVGDVDYDVDPGKAEIPLDRRTAPRAERDGTLLRWRALPGTQAEAAAIQASFIKRFADGSVRKLVKGQASEAALRRWAGRYRYLHLATHGFFAPPGLKSALGPSPKGDSDQPSAADRFQDPFGRQGVSGYHPGLLSGLVLAGANRRPEGDQDDGILTAVEVAELDLSGVELAVLSACQTGLGEEAGGEGVLGLQRAFQMASAKTVVASLWQVSDQATQKLMTKFYETLWRRERPLSKLEALRQAQLWMLREGAKDGAIRGLVFVDELEGGPGAGARLPPFYWAAFVLSGDWR